MKTNIHLLIGLLLLAIPSANAQTTAFTYQGRLHDNGAPANGIYDLRFTIYNAVTNGSAVSASQTNAAIVVSDGLFTVQLDFGGTSVFNGLARWLDIGVRTNGTGPYVSLNPRQPITSTPYATLAGTAQVSVDAATAINFSGTLAGDVTGSQGATTVAKIRGNTVSSAAPRANQHLRFVGSQWIPGFVALTTDVSDVLPLVNGGTAATNASTALANLGGAALTGTNTFTGSNLFSGVVTATNSSNLIKGAFTGNGAGLTNLSGGALAAGSVSNAALADGVVTASKLAPGAVSYLGAPDGSPTNAVQVNTNGLVGIGTNAPQAGLHIAVTGTTTGSQILFQRPDELNGFTNLAGATAVATFGNLLAVAASSDNAVTLVDISDPQSPVLRAQFRDGDGTFTNLAGANAVAIKTNLLAVAAYGDETVTLISLTNPASPVKLAELRNNVGGWNELSGIQAVAISGNVLAIAASYDSAVTLADISNPSAPIKRVEMKDGFFGFTNLEGANAVALSGNLLAIAAYNDNTVTLVDVSDPSNPIKRSEMRNGVNGFDHLLTPWKLSLVGNILAIGCAYDYYVTLVNVANPANPVKLSELPVVAPYLYAVALSSNRLATGSGYYSGEARLFDISTPSAPRLLTVMQDSVGGYDFLSIPGGLTFVGTNLVLVGENAITLAAFPSVPVGFVSQGPVGIGTTTPAAPLHVIGNVIVQDAQRFDVNANQVELGVLTSARGYASAALGYYTTASGDYSTALGYYSTASGGNSTALGDGATASGYSSTALGFYSTASGDYSIALGNNTTASGVNSFAAGKSAKAAHAGAFVWADSQSSDFASTGNNQFLIRAAGGVGINKTNPAAALDVNGTVTATALDINTGAGNFQVRNEGGLTPGINIPNGYGGTMRFRNTLEIWPSDDTSRAGYLDIRGTNGAPAVVLRSDGNSYFTGGNIGIGTSNPTNKLHVSGGVSATVFVTTSDRNAKENFTAVQSRAVLEKVAALPIAQWNFKEMPGVPHLGPTAQDFHAAFGVGGSDTGIATVDADGVALAAIQGLNQKVEEQKKELLEKETELHLLQKQNASMEKRLAEVERLLKGLAEKQ